MSESIGQNANGTPKPPGIIEALVLRRVLHIIADLAEGRGISLMIGDYLSFKGRRFEVLVLDARDGGRIELRPVDPPSRSCPQCGKTQCAKAVNPEAPCVEFG